MIFTSNSLVLYSARTFISASYRDGIFVFFKCWAVLNLICLEIVVVSETLFTNMISAHMVVLPWMDVVGDSIVSCGEVFRFRPGIFFLLGPRGLDQIYFLLRWYCIWWHDNSWAGCRLSFGWMSLGTDVPSSSECSFLELPACNFCLNTSPLFPLLWRQGLHSDQLALSHGIKVRLRNIWASFDYLMCGQWRHCLFRYHIQPARSFWAYTGRGRLWSRLVQTIHGLGIQAASQSSLSLMYLTSSGWLS